jgi:PIN domain nuclease of toxin-antitoxin system
VTVLLLDTHAYAWAVTAPDRLSDRARAAIADTGNVLLVSAASAWELAIKYRLGKWPAAEPLLAQHDTLCAELGATPHPISAGEAIRAGGLTWTHADPFDRMLAAQAMLGNFTLVTRDEAFRELPGLLSLW